MTQDRNAEMGRMAHTLGVDRLLAGDERRHADEQCSTCEKRDICHDWLDLADIRGAAQAPDFCVNQTLFADLASEARGGL